MQFTFVGLFQHLSQVLLTSERDKGIHLYLFFPRNLSILSILEASKWAICVCHPLGRFSAILILRIPQTKIKNKRKVHRIKLCHFLFLQILALRKGKAARFEFLQTNNINDNDLEIVSGFFMVQNMKSLYPKPLTSTPTRYSFAAQVTAKKPIFSIKFTANGKCWYMY